MKRATLLLMTFTVICMISCTQTGEQTKSDATQTEPSKRDYFQLKIYNYESPEQEAMIRQHFRGLPWLEFLEAGRDYRSHNRA